MTVDGRFGGLKGLGLKKKEDGEKGKKKTLWSRITKNADVSTGPLARPFAFPLALLTHSLVLKLKLKLKFFCLLS